MEETLLVCFYVCIASAVREHLRVKVFLTCLNMHQVMSLPYRCHSDDGDEPGDHDAHLGVGDCPVGQ